MTLQQSAQRAALVLELITEQSDLLGLPCERSLIEAIEAHMLQVQIHQARVQAIADAIAAGGW